MPNSDGQTGYAPVEGLSMYYEVHGTGRPTVLLHGAYMTVDMMEPLLSGLAASRQVIAPEQQGHGRHQRVRLTWSLPPSRAVTRTSRWVGWPRRS